MLGKFWEMLQWRKVMQQHSDWFDKHEPAQARFEENEEWLEELEERVDRLESDSHPCKELHEFEAYPKLIKRIEQLEEEIDKITAESNKDS
jgi:hypothetical protein|tara:strand:- start:4344 stop:4616 length:273 start_codon:yes stop_codon:yes gene_type:complete